MLLRTWIFIHRGNYGADVYCLTIERQGLRVTFETSFMNLECAAQALSFYVERLRKERKLPAVIPLREDTNSTNFTKVETTNGQWVRIWEEEK